MIRNIFTIITSLSVLFILSSCNDTSEIDVELHKKLAGELRDNKLYRAAIDEYKKILSDNSLELTNRANINYMIGKIYFEDLQDYENAAAYYIKANALDPNASFNQTASRNLVTSLEKMGRMVDAKRHLDQAANIDTVPKTAGDVEVARIGGSPVWLSEVERHIQTLPADLQKQLVHREKKINYIHNYVGTELIYRAAIRENLAEEPAVKEQLRLMEKQLLIDKYVIDKIIPNVKIDSMDVMNFYSSKKANIYNNQQFDSVKSQVFLDYQREKMGTAYTDYIESLAKVDKIEFLDHNIK